MRHLVTSVLVSIVCFVTGCASLGSKSKEMIGASAPESRLMFFDGSEVPLSSYQGKDISILFWATWCTFSRSVIERYEALARQYSRRSDLEFIAVSVDKNEDFGILKDRIKEQDLETMTHIFSGNDALDDAFVNLNGRTIPYVVFIDSSGIVRLVDSDLTALEEYLLLKFGPGAGSGRVLGGGEPRATERASVDGFSAVEPTTEGVSAPGETAKSVDQSARYAESTEELVDEAY